MEVTSDDEKTDAEKSREANQLYESALTATPGEVKRLIWLFDQSHSVLTGMSKFLGHLKGREMHLELPPPVGKSDVTLIQQIVEQCRLPRRGFHETEVEIFDELEGLLCDIVVDRDRGNASLNGLHLIAQFKRYMQLQTARLGILIIGSIAWPHEGYPRYPSPPDAPPNASKAAKKFHGYRGMGIQHYTNELGVMNHLKAIVGKSVLITTYLRNIQDNYYLLEGPTSERH